MSRKILAAAVAAVAAVLTSIPAPAAPGLFDGNLDLGRPGEDPKLPGGVTESGGVYRVTGGGSDWWDGGEFGHFVYKSVSGPFRIEANVSPIDDGTMDWWAKMGVAVRNDIATGAGNEKEVNYYTAVSGTARDVDNHAAYFQYRNDATQNMVSQEYKWWKEVTPGTWGTVKAQKVALERFSFGGKQFVASYADFGEGGGWTKVGASVATNLNNNVYVGLAVTSHNNDATEAVDFSNVSFGTPSLTVGSVPTGKRLTADLGAVTNPGLKIRTIRDARTDHAGWGYGQMNELLDTGAIGGTPGADAGVRVDPVVNLYDSDGAGAFNNGNGKADRTFPGIDAFGTNPANPADGDNDDNFATEVTGYIALTAGEHVIGINSDDGAILKIGGVEVGRTGEWKGTSNEDVLFTVAEPGVYAFELRAIEGGGGASLEIHDFDGASRALLGEGTIVIGQTLVPEPASFGLLLAGSAVAAGLRRRRRA